MAANITVRYLKGSFDLLIDTLSYSTELAALPKRGSEREENAMEFLIRLALYADVALNWWRDAFPSGDHRPSAANLGSMLILAVCIKDGRDWIGKAWTRLVRSIWLGKNAPEMYRGPDRRMSTDNRVWINGRRALDRLKAPGLF